MRRYDFAIVGFLFVVFWVCIILDKIAVFLRSTPDNVLIGYFAIISIAVPLLWILLREAFISLNRFSEEKPGNERVDVELAHVYNVSEQSTEFLFLRLRQIARELERPLTYSVACGLDVEASKISAELNLRVNEVRRYAE